MNLIAQPDRPEASNAPLTRDFGGLPPAAVSMASSPRQAQNADLLGPLVRRKYVVVLFAIIGAALGYLSFQRAEPLFRSQARLMIWAQAPPSQLGEDAFAEKISLAKFENLLGSQLVLGRAIEDANLQNTETLAMSGNGAINKLGKMIGISSDKKAADDTINLSIVGPAREELPNILNNVIDAFVKEIEGNTKEAGDESLQLIRKLEQRLLDEKQIKEVRHLELLKKLGVTERDINGDVINPKANRLTLLQEELAKLESDLLGVNARMAAIKLAQEQEDATALRVCAIEGRAFVGLEPTAATFKRNESNRRRIGLLSGQIMRLEEKIVAVDEQVFQIDGSMFSLRAKLGGKHNDVRQLAMQRQRWLERRQALETELAPLRVELEKEEQVEEGELSEDRDSSSRQRDESEWLNLYVTALVQDGAILNAQIATKEQKIASLNAEATVLSQDVDEVNILAKQIDESRAQVRSILATLPKMDVLLGNYNNIRVRVVDAPQDGLQVAPNLIRYLGIGIFLATLLGCGLAILIDRADHSFRSPTEIVDIFRAPVIGRIPRIRAVGKKGTEMANTLVVAHQPNSSVAEAMRAIRTAIFFNAANEGSKLLLFTSPSPGDGKSTTISNLAISMAQAGKKVCLVDCDFRRPRVHRYFGVKAKPGGKAFINGDLTLEECLQPSGEENLSLLTCGGHPENPGEFILQPQFSDLFEQLKEEFDFVLIDSPPVIPVSDPTVLAAYVDAIYMVLRVRKGVTISAQQTIDTLGQVEAQIQGVIVNGVDQNPYYNEYNYNYGYQMLGGYYYNKYGGGKYYERYKESYGDDDATKRRIAAEPNLPTNGRSPRRNS